MKEYLKKTIRKYAFVLNYMPLNNIFCLNGNIMSAKRAGLWKCKVKMIGKNNQIHISGKSVLSNSKITIKGCNNILRIGKGVSLKNVDIYMEDDDNIIVIGDYTSLCGKAHLACIEGSQIMIGNDCLFSSDITFRTGDSHSIIDYNGKRINPSKSINIKDHVWIGSHVIVLKGVTIEENTVIGSGSIVTNSIEEKDVIIAGVPAKIVKRDTNWCRERIMVE